MTTPAIINQNLAPFEKWEDRQFVIPETDISYPLSTKGEEMREVFISNKLGNSNQIKIGSSSMTSENATIILNVGESAEIKTDNLKNVYVMGTAGEKVNFLRVL
jgi:hypothetical protein